MSILQGRSRRPRAVRRLAPRPHSWSDWAGIRTQVCLALSEDTQDKAALWVTERGSDSVTAERALGGPNSFYQRGECGQGTVSDTLATARGQQSRTGGELPAYCEHLIPWNIPPLAPRPAEVGADLGIAPESLWPPCPRKASLVLPGGLRQENGETGSQISWGCPAVPRGQFVPLPSGRKLGIPLLALVPHLLSPPSSVLPWRPSCLSGRPQALQASSAFSVNPSPVDVPKISELPAWRAPGHQRLELTARLSVSRSRRRGRRCHLLLSVEVGAGAPRFAGGEEWIAGRCLPGPLRGRKKGSVHK